MSGWGKPALLALLPLLGGCESLNWAGPDDFLTERAIAGPSKTEVTVCRAYNCQVKTRLPLSEKDMRGLGAMFAKVGSAEDERRAVAAAVARLERIAGERLGTANDRGLLYPAGSGDPGQQDCVDEAATTTSYLLMLKANGHLRHHAVRAPTIRGFLLDGRWQHYSAAVTDTETGVDYVVDSWPRANGAEPVIWPLKDWMTSSAVEPETAAAAPAQKTR